ncbi:hypothetical protein [Loktanella sp. SALINAS62]|uniref:hypothetical protein n=1 Tax=Loktanella sp. SALINAS62 TaxID=2706124 RepID=UPI001B8D4FE0|nr:hypothetical protein [Loktanella sp. SALINAS62]MBS1300864.1 hypothetical protein [Loktanella sp. SALINAS62]
MFLSNQGSGDSRKVVHVERRRLQYGRTFSIDGNNLIVAHSRKYRPAFPWRGLVIVVICCFSMKAFLMTLIGEADYADRLARLSEGATVERVGAWLMTPDPVSAAIVQIWQRSAS